MKIKELFIVALFCCTLIAGCDAMTTRELDDPSDFARIQDWDGASRFYYEDFETKEYDLESDDCLIGVYCDPSIIPELKDLDGTFNGSIVISLPLKVLDKAPIELNASLNLGNSQESGQIACTIILTNRLGETVSLQPTFFNDDGTTAKLTALCVDREGYESEIDVASVALPNAILITIPLDGISASDPQTIYLRMKTVK